MMIHSLSEKGNLLNKRNAGQITAKSKFFHQFTAFHLPTRQLGKFGLDGNIA